MILVFQDDGTMRAIDSLIEANREYEAIDVENGEYTFLDERGCLLRPAFRSPSKKKWLFLFSIIDSGPFTLETTQEKREDLLAKLLSGEISIDPRSTGIRSLADLRTALPQLLRS
jgi:hypothetical protein